MELVPNEEPASPALLTVSDQDLLHHGNFLVPQESAELLPAFLRASESHFSIRWTGENEIVAASSDLARTFTATRIVSFEDGSPELRTGEVQMTMIRCADGCAIRVRMDRLFILSKSTEAPRLLDVADKALPVVLSITLRFMRDGAPMTETVAFTETLDPTLDDHPLSAEYSDWVSVVPGSVPHSVEFHLIAREDLDQFTKMVRDAGLSVFEVVDSIGQFGLR